MIRVALVQGSLLYGQNVMNRLSLGRSGIKLLLVKLTKTIPKSLGLSSPHTVCCSRGCTWACGAVYTPTSMKERGLVGIRNSLQLMMRTNENSTAQILTPAIACMKTSTSMLRYT